MSDKLIYRLIVALTVFSVLGMVFFGLAALLSPAKILPAGAAVNDGVTIFARYMAGRNLSIALLMVAALVVNKRTMLGYFLLLNGIVQAFDSVFGILGGQIMQTVFPVILCVLNLLAAKYLLGHNTKVTKSSPVG